LYDRSSARSRTIATYRIMTHAGRNRKQFTREGEAATMKILFSSLLFSSLVRLTPSDRFSQGDIPPCVDSFDHQPLLSHVAREMSLRIVRRNEERSKERQNARPIVRFPTVVFSPSHLLADVASRELHGLHGCPTSHCFNAGPCPRTSTNRRTG